MCAHAQAQAQAHAPKGIRTKEHTLLQAIAPDGIHAYCTMHQLVSAHYCKQSIAQSPAKSKSPSTLIVPDLQICSCFL